MRRGRNKDVLCIRCGSEMASAECCHCQSPRSLSAQREWTGGGLGLGRGLHVQRDVERGAWRQGRRGDVNRMVTGQEEDNDGLGMRREWDDSKELP